MRSFISCVAILVLGPFALASEDVPELPSRDAFYTPRASNWTEEEAGTILDSRTVTIDLPILPGGVIEFEAFQLLYVTQDLEKKKATSVTTIIVPQGANTSRILSYQIAYDAPDINCSPSYGLQKGANKAAVQWTLNQMLFVIEALADAGSPVLNIPDYEGSNAAFTVGPQSAYQTLDSIRAATNSGKITGIDEDAETILFGYSGGGFASEWAVEFHHDYASDVKVIGAAIGGPPPNVMNTYRNVNRVVSGLNVWAMLGVMNAIPRVNDSMRKDLKDDHREQFLGGLLRCSEPDVAPPKIPSWANISSWFEHGDQFLTEFEPELTEIGVMGNRITEDTAPKFPLYIYQGSMDLITAPYKDTEALKKKFCDAGTHVFLVKYNGMGHATTLFAGTTWAMKWIKKVFNGEEIKNGCDEDHEVDAGAGGLAGLFGGDYADGDDFSRGRLGLADDEDPHFIQSGARPVDAFERVEL
ncbi:putative lipase [Aspergillus alliaceus]|uniref:putative lipase n=1 Tax=Petromyces alliaceus TaxID=209559 RepID=UPI0012A56955|nr:secretory lipase-domain-containing protein [Aspergillus alliaceus]KAB8231216.1 secretory lipase-domain-containing protein [Aspergillus alliaceus]